jgi:hypothetical protein
MMRTYIGGCACGAIRYEVSGEPIAMLDCQCRQCQRESGTGHASHLTFKNVAPRLSGKPSLWRMQGDQGITKERAFCPQCGCPVYMTFPDMPDYFVIRAASLDDPSLYRPQFATWTAAAQPWDRVGGDIATFDKMPPPPA